MEFLARHLRSMDSGSMTLGFPSLSSGFFFVVCFRRNELMFFSSADLLSLFLLCVLSARCSFCVTVRVLARRWLGFVAVVYLVEGCIRPMTD